MTLKDTLTKGPRPIWIRYLFIIGIFTVLTRMVLDSRFGASSALYVLIPYLVGLTLFLFVPPIDGTSKLKRFTRHLVASLCVMLCTSAILFEGFICVLMFMPIYIVFAGLAYALGPKKNEDGRIDYSDTFRLSFAPLLIAVLTVEGLSGTTSFNPENNVKRSHIVDLSIEKIHENLASPIQLNEDRNLFLSIFPLPDYIEAGSLNVGDIHKSYFTYRRWGPLSFNNKTIHKGETWLQLETVSPTRITTKVIKDSSYFSHYLTVHGTQIDLAAIDETQTKITLTLHYRRELSPAWYFGPMQKYAMKESADYLIENVIARSELN